MPPSLETKEVKDDEAEAKALLEEAEAEAEEEAEEMEAAALLKEAEAEAEEEAEEEEEEEVRSPSWSPSGSERAPSASLDANNNAGGDGNSSNHAFVEPQGLDDLLGGGLSDMEDEEDMLEEREVAPSEAPRRKSVEEGSAAAARQKERPIPSNKRPRDLEEGGGGGYGGDGGSQSSPRELPAFAPNAYNNGVADGSRQGKRIPRLAEVAKELGLPKLPKALKNSNTPEALATKAAYRQAHDAYCREKEERERGAVLPLLTASEEREQASKHAREKAEREEKPREENAAAGPAEDTNALLERWSAAKKARDYTTSDKLREELRKHGIEPDPLGRVASRRRVARRMPPPHLPRTPMLSSSAGRSRRRRAIIRPPTSYARSFESTASSRTGAACGRLVVAPSRASGRASTMASRPNHSASLSRRA